MTTPTEATTTEAKPNASTGLAAPSSRETYWGQLIREAKADPAWATAFQESEQGTAANILEPDRSWTDLGDRGKTAQILYARGLRSKARRFADCARVGFRRVCSNEPEDHKFYTTFNCGLRFCRTCAPKLFRQLFNRYVQPLVAFVKDHCGQEGYTLAHFDFTIRASGEVPTPEDVRSFNKAIRKVLKAAVPKNVPAGALWCDEFGHEKPHKHSERRAGGWNLHAHGLYFGPYLKWRKVRDAWSRATNGSTGFRITEERNWRTDPARGVRKALGHMLKYVSKPPAETPERTAALESAFAGVRRVHSVGVFYNLQKITVPNDEIRQGSGDERCPICGGAFYIARWPPTPVSDLRYEGLRDLEEVRHQVGRRRVFGGVP